MRVNPGFVVQHVLDDLIEFLFNQCYRYFHRDRRVRIRHIRYSARQDASRGSYDKENFSVRSQRCVSHLGVRVSAIHLSRHTQSGQGIAACITANTSVQFFFPKFQAIGQRKLFYLFNILIGLVIAGTRRYGVADKTIVNDGIGIATLQASLFQHLLQRKTVCFFVLFQHIAHCLG